MSRNTRWETHVGELKNVTLLKKWMGDRFIRSCSPFHSPSFVRSTLSSLVTYLIDIFEKSLGKIFYIEDQLLEWQGIDIRCKRLLLKLKERSLITGWALAPCDPEIPKITHVVIHIADIKSPKGRAILSKAHGEGSDHTLNTAFVPALAETLERIALADWRATKFFVGTYDEMNKRGIAQPILPSRFVHHKTENEPLSFDGNSFHWMQCKHLTDQGEREAIIPAQLVYLGFDKEYNEQQLAYTTSNGAAAGKTSTMAVLKGILELIERDSFLLAWLLKKAPPRITFSKRGYIYDILEHLRQSSIETWILDITSNLAVPTFCCLFIDALGAKPVMVGTKAGFDIEAVIESLLVDALKQLHFSDALERFFANSVTDGRVKSITDRKHYWMKKELIPEIFFLKSGAEHAMEDVKERYSVWQNLSEQELLRHTIRILREKNINIFYSDITSQVAAEERIRIVKCVSPDLLPMYFDELFVPVRHMRLQEGENRIVTLNTTPHPFL